MEGKTIESRSYGNTDEPENQQLLPHHLAFAKPRLKIGAKIASKRGLREDVCKPSLL
jgi:hypothetical protein